MLDERQRAALSACVTSILEDLATGATSATTVSAAMDAVLSAANSACAGFATQWNDVNMRGIAKGLPVELLTACLAPADFKTRLRASHVSRAWRSALISDRQLWNHIYCPITRDSERACQLLDALLERSSPLPFSLKIPRSRYANFSVYHSSIDARVAPHIHRLQSYEGPAIVFMALDPSRRVLPTLASFDCLCASDLEEGLDLGPELSAQRLPNLRRLAVPMLRLTDLQPYERLQHLVCGLRSDTHYAALFHCFPNLVTAEFIVDGQLMHLPPGPLPRSVERVTIRAKNPPGGRSGDPGADFLCLAHWATERIPRLVLHGAGFLSAIASAFAATHGGALRLDVGRTVDIASAPDAQYVWAVHPRDSFWDGDLSGGEMRALLVGTAVARVSVTSGVFRPFFAARARLPHLVSLTFDLRHLPSASAALPEYVAGARHYVETPNLQHVCLELGDHTSALRVLRRHFRAMLVYDAALLETLTVDHLGHPATEDSDCAGLAHFAKRYIEVR